MMRLCDLPFTAIFPANSAYGLDLSRVGTPESSATCDVNVVHIFNKRKRSILGSAVSSLVSRVLVSTLELGLLASGLLIEGTPACCVTSLSLVALGNDVLTLVDVDGEFCTSDSYLLNL